MVAGDLSHSFFELDLEGKSGAQTCKREETVDGAFLNVSIVATSLGCVGNTQRIERLFLKDETTLSSLVSSSKSYNFYS